MNELVLQDLFKETIKTPSAEEQEKIGSFLAKIDDTIALHQRANDSHTPLKCHYFKSYQL